MLALLFDMNNLWEEYVLVKLKQACSQSNLKVLGQRSKTFWNNITIRPDIIVKEDDKTVCVIDTKWKRMDNAKPSTNDLRQMYVYNEYWNSIISILLYPSNGEQNHIIKKFVEPSNHFCGLVRFNILDSNGKLDD